MARAQHDTVKTHVIATSKGTQNSKERYTIFITRKKLKYRMQSCNLPAHGLPRAGSSVHAPFYGEDNTHPDPDNIVLAQTQTAFSCIICFPSLLAPHMYAPPPPPLPLKNRIPAVVKVVDIRM